MWQKIINEISGALTEIRSGDVLSTYATIYGFMFVGATLVIFQKSVLGGILFLVFSPIPFFLMAVLTRIALSRFSKDLDSLSHIEEQAKNNKPVVRHQKFTRRFYHAEYRVNADANVINNYLLQQYTSIAEYSEHGNITYIINGILSVDPKKTDETFQYGFIASGTKEIGGKSQKFLSGSIRPVLSIENIPEMFFVTISQSADKVSIVSFDTDNKDISSFATGLMQELRKGFSVRVIQKMRDT
jgi:hypothetical protein